MAVKTITITEEAYRRLARRKGPQESFSEAISRLVPETSPRDLVGALDFLDETDWRRFERALRDSERGLDKDLRKTLTRMRQ